MDKNESFETRHIIWLRRKCVALDYGVFQHTLEKE
jgi:hypothetical protein